MEDIYAITQNPCIEYPVLSESTGTRLVSEDFESESSWLFDVAPESSHSAESSERKIVWKVSVKSIDNSGRVVQRVGFSGSVQEGELERGA